MLNIQPTSKTPFVLIDFTELYFEMRGNSVNQTPLQFYDPIFKYIDDYFFQVNHSIYLREYSFLTLHFYMEFIAYQDFEMIRQIDWIFYHIEEFKTFINWYYDPNDEDYTEQANDVKMTFRNPVRLITN